MSGNTKFKYQFTFPDGRQHAYEVELANPTNRLVSTTQTKSNASHGTTQDWTDLEHQKCKNCPLKKEDYPKCPLAANLAAVASDFRGEKSHDKVTVEVITHERTYLKAIRLQEGLFGIFGLIMATSDCPHFEFLRPMARFHLPFSTHKETTVRSVSFYLLKQYFVAKNGGKPDFELNQLKQLYLELETVNLGLVQRLRSITTADADANSIVILDGFAKLLSASLSTGLQDLEALFTS